MKKFTKSGFTLPDDVRNPRLIHSEHGEESSGRSPHLNATNHGGQVTTKSKNSSKLDRVTGSFGKPQDERKAAFTLAEGGRSPLFNATKNTKAAFTMAEVLITLGIIGVVAAMTLPTIIHKIEQQVLIQQFKKMYANLNTALQQAVFQDNDGNPYDCLDKTTCKQFHNDFTKHLKLIKTETIGDLPYKTEEDVLAEGGTLSSHSKNNLESRVDENGNKFGLLRNRTKSNNYIEPCGYYKYYLADGSVFYSSKLNCTVGYSTIIIDVNGDKNPNRWGYDAHVLEVVQKDNGAFYIGGESRLDLVEKGGLSAKDIIKK